jgi:hypothetical protein
VSLALLVVRELDALDILHTINGSIASSIAGEPRSTVAIDIVDRQWRDILGIIRIQDRPWIATISVPMHRRCRWRICSTAR